MDAHPGHEIGSVYSNLEQLFLACRYEVLIQQIEETCLVLIGDEHLDIGIEGSFHPSRPFEVHPLEGFALVQQFGE